MPAKITKKEALKILKKQYSIYTPEDYITALCHYCPEQLRKDWIKNWHKINTESVSSIGRYFNFNDEDRDIHISLARLLTLHMFINDTYE